MQLLLTLFTYCAIFIIFMVNQNNGMIPDVEYYKYYRIGERSSRSIYNLRHYPLLLIQNEPCIIQKNISKANENKIHSGNVHLWFGIASPLTLRLKIIEIFTDVVEKMRKICGSLETIQLFREVHNCKSRVLSEILCPNQRTKVHAKLFKIKSTEEDVIIRKVPIDNTKVKEEDALVLFCYEGIFIFLGEKITPEERSATITFSDHFESADSMKYYLENRIKKIINIKNMNHLKAEYASAERSQSSHNNYMNRSYAPAEPAEPYQSNYYDHMSGTYAHAEPSQPSYDNFVSDNYAPPEPYQSSYYDFMSGTYTHAKPSQSNYNNFINDSNAPAEAIQSSDYDFISDRYEYIHMNIVDLDQNAWIKSPTLKDLDENVAFKLVDFKENIMFIHIPINANSSLIAELFKSVEIEIENWHLEDQIEVSVLQNGQYTAELLIHFPGWEKINLMSNCNQNERNRNETKAKNNIFDLEHEID